MQHSGRKNQSVTRGPPPSLGPSGRQKRRDLVPNKRPRQAPPKCVLLWQTSHTPSANKEEMQMTSTKKKNTIKIDYCMFIWWNENHISVVHWHFLPFRAFWLAQKLYENCLCDSGNKRCRKRKKKKNSLCHLERMDNLFFPPLFFFSFSFCDVKARKERTHLAVWVSHTSFNFFFFCFSFFAID